MTSYDENKSPLENIARALVRVANALEKTTRRPPRARNRLYPVTRASLVAMSAEAIVGFSVTCPTCGASAWSRCIATRGRGTGRRGETHGRRRCAIGLEAITGDVARAAGWNEPEPPTPQVWDEAASSARFAWRCRRDAAFRAWGVAELARLEDAECD